MKKLKTKLGDYFAFHLQCDTDFGEIFEKLNTLGFDVVFNNMNQNQKQTFSHEFVHYLQNISTYCGVISFENFIEELYFQITAEQIKKEIVKDDKIIEQHNKNERIYKEKHKLFLKERGDMDINDNPSIYRIDNIDILTNDELKIPTAVIKISWKKGHNPKYPKIKNVNYNFGNFAVMESMANLYEHIVFGAEKISEAPYSMCKKVADYYLEFELCDEVLLALCELSLNYNSNAGVAFCCLCKVIKECNIELKNVNDVKAFYNLIKSELVKALYSIKEAIIKRQINIAKYIDKIYPIKEGENYKNWEKINLKIKETFLYAFIARLGNPFLISDNVSYILFDDERKIPKGMEDKVDSNDRICRFMGLLAMFPFFVINSEKQPELCCTESDVAGIMLGGIALSENLKSPKSKCYMYNICKVTKEKKLGAYSFDKCICERNPMEQKISESCDCAFALHAAHWGFIDNPLV